MIKAEAKKRIEKLTKEIDFHRYNYHVLDKETLAPAALDNLKAELFRLENEFPEFIFPSSPTQRVAGAVSGKFKKTIHSLPMISLFDAFSQNDILAWQERNENYLKKTLKPIYYCELKLDGLAINIKYEKGLFILAGTRGDGKVGENVSSNVKVIASVPLNLRRPEISELKALGLSEIEIKNFLELLEKGIIEVRGEAIMTKKVFVELNKRYQAEGKTLLANTRNAVAGSIRQLDSRISAERKLDFYAYDIIFSSGKDSDSKVLSRGELIKTRGAADKLASLLGFKSLKYNTLCQGLEDVFSFYKEIEKKREALAFEIDGVVVKFDDLKMWEILGVVGKAPRYMMAYKFSAEQATTRIKNIIWQVGRTGALTPTAVLEPVRVAGALISRSTLHNFDEIRRLDLMIGDTIVIERSGDVIPKVISVLKNLRSGEEKIIKAPKICPICEGKIDRVGEEVAYRCLNKNCYAVNLRKISHFISKGAVDMEGVGPKVIEQFLEIGLIKDAADLYTLKKEDLLSLERFAEKKADNVLKIIEIKKKIDLAHFIFALGIRHVGEETAEIISKLLISDLEMMEKGKGVFSIASLIKYFLSKNLDYFQQINGLGPIMGESIYNYFQDEHNLNLLKKFDDNGVEISLTAFLKKTKIENKNFKDKTFVLTGSLLSLTRETAKDKIKELGGKVSADVSVKTDYLLLGDDPGSKFEKAKKLGVKIITEEEFLKMI
ncbi:NAD-dependent DNA ligase LigA [Candidatus Falkowbacteria bacterium]|nr:NAD-dependent DNA ligase LigA [Candidatus Falkowbacteria bacterium]